MISAFHLAAGYDINCVYPDKWFDNPFSSINSMSGFYTEFVTSRGVETPVVVRTSHQSTMCRGMCLSLHDEDVYDPFDLEPSFVTVPPFGQNAYSIVMCISQCVLHVMDGFYNFKEESMAYFKSEFGLDNVDPNSRNDIYNAWVQKEIFNNLQPMMSILEDEDYHPFTMGSVAGMKVRFYADRDGWNSDGALTYDRATGMAVPCTGSCRNYQDTTGYEPVPDPRIHTYLSNDSSKYACTGDCRRWQPLQEGDSGGSLKKQQFTMAHIGQKAKTYLRDVTITLQDPQYDLYEESLLVIERLKNTTTDFYMQDAVAIFDSKLGVRGIISRALRSKFAEPRIHSLQDEILFKVGLSSVEYDAVVQAWAEKKYHDLVRPTTVIKHWANDNLFTYGGDMEMGGPVNIKARDFEAFIRVMPHGEFPSGSSCLCTAYYEFADVFFGTRYGDTLSDIEWHRHGTDRYYTLENMEALRDVCGVSRLWGGMHYTAAIAAGEEVCSGLGDLAYNYVTALKNGSTYDGGDGAWYYGDEVNYDFSQCS